MNPESLPLRDIHLPDTVAWWPLAPGWWLLLLLSLVACAFLLWRWWRLPARQVRAAIRAVNVEFARWQQGGDARELLAGLSTVLRRHAIAVHGRERAAGLSGDDWQALLNAGLPDAPFASAPGVWLLDGWLRPTPPDLNDADGEALRALCLTRIREALR